MWGLLTAECRKYRGSYITVLSLLGMLCPVLLVVGMFILKQHDFITNGRFTYNFFTQYMAQLLVLIIGPIITSFIASFSIYHEYQQTTMKNLLSSPHSRSSILLSKLIYVCILVLLEYLLVAILCPVLATVIGVPVTWHSALTQGSYFCLVGAATLVVLPLMMFITLWFESFVPAMVLTVVGTAANILTLNWDKSYLSLWSIPADILLIMEKNLKMAMALPLTSLAIYAAVGILAAFIYFNYADQASA